MRGTTSFVVKVRQSGAPRDVAATVARHLADHGVPHVVAPIVSNEGATSVEAGPLSLTVYPFIDGIHAKDLGISDAAWRALGMFARRLHSTRLPTNLAAVVCRDTYALPEIETLVRVTAAVESSTDQSDGAHAVRAVWRDHRAVIDGLTERTRELRAAIGRRSLPLVLCHADMHSGNVLIDRRGALWVIDWDEVVLAPRERDLMFAIGGISSKLVSDRATELFLEGYGHVQPDSLAMAYYRHAWAIQDVGGFGARALLDASATNQERIDAATILRGLFEPGEIVDIARRWLID
jgi:spectinomycin phosphotransferase